MKKALLLMALFAGSLLGANAQTATADHLTALVKPGTQKQLTIQLKNGIDYTAFQMKISLPDGMTFAGDPALSNRSDSHQIHFSKSTDNKTMTVAVFSYEETGGTKKGNLAFKENKGPVLLVNVTIDPEVLGAFKNESCDVSGITVADVEFVQNSDLKGKALALTSVGKLGDTNGDKKINGTDASKVVDHILGNVLLSDEEFERSSFTGGDNVSGPDYSNIVDIILN